jgi:hypothetical protein
MNSAKYICAVVGGVVSGIVLVLSCGDDRTSSVDAATSCDCPASEPPIATRIMEIVNNTRSLPPANMAPANGRAGDGVECPMGSVLLTGGCSAGVGQVPDIVIEQSFPNGRGWACLWRNNSNNTVPVRVIARCLVPAS